ncbi:MAG TPA: hypothetical protein VEB59_08310 [Gemmatimonadales bacterium]|nr:hypothetical protein [Gemmatimonadales bacterium]
MSPSVYELHLRCQALQRGAPLRRRSHARRIAVAAEAAKERAVRLRDILGELRSHRLWR